MNVFRTIKRIQEGVEDSHLDMEEIRSQCGREIDSLCSMLGISEVQCVFLAAIVEFDAYCGASVVNMAAGLGCKTIDIYIMSDELEDLIGNGYVYRTTIEGEDRYRITPSAMKAFRENRALEPNERKKQPEEQHQENRHCRSGFEPEEHEVDMLLPCHKHSRKQLLLNVDEQTQYDELVELLQSDRFNEVNRNLKEAGLRGGFTCLFYGPPGTGKTEAAYQIANATGRDIYQADMSQLHDKWVGGSEKNARQIFDQYLAKILKSKNTPILLLNEADAIISRRIESADTSVGIMYNRVQNILLQALEDFQGILIATTNLETNFDSAFERRFLYNMRFQRPEAAVRTRLWKSVVDTLSDEDCSILAEEFPDFAGGQIVNIGRKVIIDRALHSRSIDLQRMREFCVRETIAPKHNQVGFRINNQKKEQYTS